MYVHQQVEKGLENVAVVAGVIAPGLQQLFFAGKPVSASRHVPVRLDGDTQYLIASITKTFASSIFYRRHGNYGGAVGDFISTRLPRHLANLPIVDLANYSPGFPTDDFGGAWWNYLGADQLITLLDNLADATSLPQCSPGTLYSYSNFGWGLLGLAALRVRSLRDDVTRQWSAAITEVRSDLRLSPLTVPRKYASNQHLIAGYSGTQLLPRSWMYEQASWATLFASGDLVSTGHDMLIWLAYNMGRHGGSLTQFKEQQGRVWSWSQEIPAQPNGTLTCPPPIKPHNPPVQVSKAWFHFNTPSSPSVTYLSKNGGEKGFSSWIGFNQWVDTGSPSQYGAFALANIKNGADIVGKSIIDLLLA